MHAARIGGHRLSVATRQTGIAWIDAISAVRAIVALTITISARTPAALAITKARESAVVRNSRVKNEPLCPNVLQNDMSPPRPSNGVALMAELMLFRPRSNGFCPSCRVPSHTIP